ncbi:MAG: hypothetical protein QGF94_04410 [Candidatus Thalassarchaeaceae archaeon]|nr:hypothetical protein [Candidatus Thalassarchaeaceae archaeon]
MSTRTHLCVVLVALLFLPSIAMNAAATDSAVELENPIWLSEGDLGLEAVASGGSSTQKILVAGADGYARLLDGDNPNEQIELAHENVETFRSISWHPRGNTALLGGDGGTLLRYAEEDHSLTTVDTAGQLSGIDIHAVTWNTAGSYAYVGGQDGWIWAYHEGESGNAVFELLVTESGSQITDIDCHPEINLCLISTLDDGLAIVDSRTEHTLYWIGGESRMWHGVSCADPFSDKCIAIGDERGVGIISLDTDHPEQSVVMIKILYEIQGEFTHVHQRVTGESLITMSPFQVIAWDIPDDEAYGWISNSDVMNASSALAGERLVGSWTTVDDDYVGYLVTSYGAIIQFHPEIESNAWTDSMISYVVGAMVIIAVPGVVLGLIFMNSETLQRKYHERRNSKHEASEQRRVAAEKDAKKLARSKKNR